MSKGLEALDNLRCMASLSRDCSYTESNDLCDIIEKELKDKEKKDKALEIIKKYICVNKPFGGPSYIYLNDESEMIPDEEYDLLKEVLK